MQLSAMMLLLAAVGTFSVQAGVISERPLQESSEEVLEQRDYVGACRQFDCTLEIRRGAQDPGSFRAQILADSTASILQLNAYGNRAAYSDGIAISDLKNPDAEHPGAFWATLRIHRGQPLFPGFQQDREQDLPGVRGVRQATLKYCVGRKYVDCKKDANCRGPGFRGLACGTGK